MSSDANIETNNGPVKLEKYLVTKCPPTVYYVPDFITSEEEQFLLKNVYSVPKPKWTQLSHRRLQNWGGIPHPNGMIAETIPKWLQDYMDKITNLNVFGLKRPNHVLINEYEPGQGIMPHLDGPLFYPTITTISLGSHTLLDFYSQSGKTEKPEFSLFVEPRSLLVLQDAAYADFMHGIEERTDDMLDGNFVNLESNTAELGKVVPRKTRISLTIRHVPKTTKIRLQLGPRKT